MVPATFHAAAIDTSYYYIDLINATLTWKRKPAIDSVLVTYRVFPFKMNEVVKRYAYDSIRNNFIATPQYNAGIKKNNENALFNFGSEERRVGKEG